MNIATVLAVTLSIIGLMSVFICLWLLFASLFPRFIRKAQPFCAKPGKSFLWGLAVGLVPFLIGAALSGSAFGKVLGWPLLIAILTAAFAGTAVLASRIGSGMASQVDRTDPWRRTLRGGVVLAFTFLTPFLGWFVWIPAAGILGTGITFQTLRKIRRERREQREMELAEAELRREEEKNLTDAEIVT